MRGRQCVVQLGALGVHGDLAREPPDPAGVVEVEVADPDLADDRGIQTHEIERRDERVAPRVELDLVVGERVVEPPHRRVVHERGVEARVEQDPPAVDLAEHPGHRAAQPELGRRTEHGHRLREMLPAEGEGNHTSHAVAHAAKLRVLRGARVPGV